MDVDFVDSETKIIFLISLTSSKVITSYIPKNKESSNPQSYINGICRTMNKNDYNIIGLKS